MVKYLNHISALLRLIRWPNLLIVAATQVLVRQCIISPILKDSGLEPQLPLSLFVILVIATVFITAGGYAINDYFDRKIDRVNKPQSIIVGHLIYPRHAMAYHLIFTISGLLLGTWVALQIKELYLSLVFFMVSGLLWFYSTIYKRELLLGNTIVALLTALVPFLVLLFELPVLVRNYGSTITPIPRVLVIWVLGFSLFAFLVNLNREIVKDMEDFEGDQAYGKRTIPVVWGLEAARWVSVTLSGITIALLGFTWFWFVRDNVTLVYFLLMITLPLIVVISLSINSLNKTTQHKASFWLKMVMLGGLGYMIAVNLIINFIK